MQGGKSEHSQREERKEKMLKRCERIRERRTGSRQREVEGMVSLQWDTGSFS